MKIKEPTMLAIKLVLAFGVFGALCIPMFKKCYKPLTIPPTIITDTIKTDSTTIIIQTATENLDSI